MPRLFLVALALGAAPLHAQTDLAFINDFNGTGGFNRACLNDGAGAYTCGFLPDNTTRLRSHGVAAADVDGDGDDDVILAVVAGTSLSAANRLCLNTGPGTFSCADLSADLDNSEGVAAADLDGDGDPDLAFANRGGTDEAAPNRVCLNTGGAFACAALDGGESYGVAATDLDGDGDADLVFANDGPGLAGARDRVCLNDGAAAFTCADLSTDAGKGDAVVAGDLDEDGDADLVVANFLGRDRVCLNDGAATFTCADVSSDAGDTFAVALADLDGDGDPDLAFANAILNSAGRTNTVCLNDGAAAFTCASVGPDTDNSRGVAAVDVDADGDADLVFANEDFFSGGTDRGQERLCLNDGAAAFTCSDLATNSDDSFGVAVGNFRGMPLADAPPPSAADGATLVVGPTPARGATAAVLVLRQPATVAVDVHDALGRRVLAGAGAPLAAGRHRLPLDVRDLPAGLYVVRAVVGGTSLMRPLVIVR